MLAVKKVVVKSMWSSYLKMAAMALAHINILGYANI